MSYLKPLATAFLSTLFAMQMPFDATPPAHAQENDCVIYALAGAARMEREQVLRITGLMDGTALGPENVLFGLGQLGLGLDNRGQQTEFATRDELESYLRVIGRIDNAEFIVGWRPSTGAGIGHVVNARVIGGRVRYIDYQAECESPDPAAEPPRNGNFIYYSWITYPRAISVPDLGLMLGGLSLEDTGNSTLVRRSVNAPARNPIFGNFTGSCRDINLNTDFSRTSQYSLSAECEDSRGKFQGTAILLDGYITNRNGALGWQSGGDFGGSVENCSIDVDVYTVLICQAKNSRGSLRKAAINLDVKIQNDDGELTGTVD